MDGKRPRINTSLVAFTTQSKEYSKRKGREEYEKQKNNTSLSSSKTIRYYAKCFNAKVPISKEQYYIFKKQNINVFYDII